MNHYTDVALVGAARAGDKEAFRQLVERYQAMTHRIAMNMIGHKEVARDLAQESILQAYLSLDRLHEPSRFGSWLYGITLNVCRGYLRDQRIDFTSLESRTGGLRYDGPLVDPHALDPLVVVEARELRETVLAAVEGLSKKNRNSVLLFYYEALSIQEIAALLDVSVSAVKSRLYQARQQLKQSLAALYEERQAPKFVTERNASMINISVADVVVNIKTVHRIVVLVDEQKERALPMWVGPFEADSIAMTLKEISTPRPLTHDFIVNILGSTAMTVEEVRIESLKEKTFYAVAKLRHGEQIVEVDTRPSDAVALAVRTNSPIYATTAVMEQAGRSIPQTDQTTRTDEDQFYSIIHDAKNSISVEEAWELLEPPALQSRLAEVAKHVGPTQESQPVEKEKTAEEKAQEERDREALMAFVFGGS